MRRYRDVGLLAEGGMALVAQAERDDGVTVVLKRVRPPFCFDATYLRLFADEGKVHAALAHPNVVRLLDQGEDESGPYLVFEHVEGSDLALVLEARAAAPDPHDRPLPTECVLAVAIPLFRALAAVHAATDAAGAPLRVVHRDVTPGNVLLSTDGDVKLTDFGVAASALKSEATVAGELKGKFAYMAPEQTRGEPVDARTDLFAGGVVLWECLAGRRLFDGPTDADVVALVRAMEVPTLDTVLPELPPALAALVARLLAKSPDQRPSGAREVVDALELIALELGLDEGLRSHAARLARLAPRHAPRPPDIERRRQTQRVVGYAPKARASPWRPRSKRGWLAATAGIGVALVAVVVAGLPARRDDAQDVPPTGSAASALVSGASEAAAVRRTDAQGPDAPIAPPGPPSSPPEAAPPRAISPVNTQSSVPAHSVAARGSMEPPPRAPPRTREPRAEPSPASGATAVALGKLSITSEPWASVSIDGAPVARETPLRGWVLPAGRHVVVLENPVYGSRTLELEVAPGAEVRRFVDLTR